MPAGGQLTRTNLASTRRVRSGRALPPTGLTTWRVVPPHIDLDERVSYADHQGRASQRAVDRALVNQRPGSFDRRRSGWWKWWRERHQEFVEAELPGRVPTPEQHALSKEERSAIWRSFRELSARQQEVFALRQLEEWSTEEVAETLGLSPGSIKRHLYRAVHHMRQALRGRE